MEQTESSRRREFTLKAKFFVMLTLYKETQALAKDLVHSGKHCMSGLQCLAVTGRAVQGGEKAAKQDMAP